MRSIGDNPSEFSVQNTFSKYLFMFLSFVKIRSQLYIFPWATLISIIIASNGVPDAWMAGSVVSAIYFSVLATYIYNDVTDLGIDRINASKRPLATGLVSKRSAMILFTVLTSLAIALSALVNFQTALVTAIFAALGIIYSHPKTHCKDKFPLKTLITASGAALASIIGGFAVENLSAPVIFASILFFLYFFILGPLGDIDDIKGDKSARRRTFPLVIGIKSTLALILSIPLAIMLSSIFIYEIIGINLLGVLLIITVCSISFSFLYPLIKRYNDRNFVQATRHKVRFMHVWLQLAVLLGVLIV